jgi:hypothetical protein
MVRFSRSIQPVRCNNVTQQNVTQKRVAEVVRVYGKVGRTIERTREGIDEDDRSEAERMVFITCQRRERRKMGSTAHRTPPVS